MNEQMGERKKQIVMMLTFNFSKTSFLMLFSSKHQGKEKEKENKIFIGYPLRERGFLHY